MNRGSLGIRELNLRLRAELNPARQAEPWVEKFGWLATGGRRIIEHTEADAYWGDGEDGSGKSILGNLMEVRSELSRNQSV